LSPCRPIPENIPQRKPHWIAGFTRFQQLLIGRKAMGVHDVVKPGAIFAGTA
jgi:hypothetical protein